MATIARPSKRALDYPTSDGRPMAETDVHRDLMVDLIQTLELRFVQNRDVYVSGNLLVYYREGDRRRHLSPDVFIVRGVEKRKRKNYLIWEEGKGPDAVIEITSQSTRDEDIEDKFHLYQAELRVPEYFLFDPFAEYLFPQLKGYRLRGGNYISIRPVAGRIPSKTLALDLEPDGTQLRLYDRRLSQRLPTPREMIARENEVLEREKLARLQAEAEVERLRGELDQMRRGLRRT